MTWLDASRFVIASAVNGPVTPTSSMRKATRPTRPACYWSNSVINPWIVRNVIAVLEVKWCMVSRDTHHRRGGAKGGCLDSICASNCGQWILNYLMTFSVDSQRLMTRGHVVFISAIRFNYRVKWVIDPVMTVKKRSFTMVSMMCSITRSNWCAPHQTRVRGHSLCIALLRRVTTPETQLVMFRTPSEDTPSRWTFQPGRITSKKDTTI
jgi:hypothetical protein